MFKHLLFSQIWGKLEQQVSPSILKELHVPGKATPEGPMMPLAPAHRGVHRVGPLLGAQPRSGRGQEVIALVVVAMKLEVVFDFIILGFVFVTVTLAVDAIAVRSPLGASGLRKRAVVVGGALGFAPQGEAGAQRFEAPVTQSFRQIEKYKSRTMEKVLKL